MKAKRLPMKRIVAMYRKGYGLVAVGKRFGVSGKTIQARLVGAGEPRRLPGRRAPDQPQRDAEILERYNTPRPTCGRRANLRQLGKEFGLSYERIRQIVRGIR